MIEEQGRVISVAGSRVWVETGRKTTCSGCSARHGCGQHLSEKYKSSSAFSYIQAESDESLSVGDGVIVGIPEGSLIKASVAAYLIPLLLVMMALWFSRLIGLGDGGTLLLSAFALVIGYIPARQLSSRQGDMCRVEVVRVLGRQRSSAELLSIGSV